MSGDSLLRRFSDNRIGAQVILGEGEAEMPLDLPRLRAASDRVCVMSPERAEAMVRDDEKGDWGTMMRKNPVLLPEDPEDDGP